VRCRRYSGSDNVTEQIRRSADTVVLLHCPKCPLKAPRGAAIAVLLIESVMLFLCVVKPILLVRRKKDEKRPLDILPDIFDLP
jgi:hypothetical protein